MIYIILLLCFALGVPIAFSLGTSCVLAITADPSLNMVWIAQKMFAGINSFPYLALPFFILAGNIMAEGGISRRLVTFFSAIVGRFRGGLAIVAVLVSLFFGAICGSAAACCAAVGAILIPGMLEKRYSNAFSAATVSAASCLGVMIPPSVPMVLYCFMAGSGASISDGFMAGIVPGIIFGLAFILVALIVSRKNDFGGDRKYSGKEILHALLDSVLAFLTPVIILGGIYSGIFTATEAAVIAVFYSIIISMFVYREMSWKKLAKVFLESGILAASILLIISIAAVFSVILSKQHVPQLLAQFFASVAQNKYVFLLFVNILLLILGMFMENASCIIIMTPLLAPIAASYGVNLIHFGVIMVCNLAIGMVTPPFGLCLFMGADLAKAKLGDTIRSLVPYLVVSVIALALITYIPAVSMGLVDLLKGLGK
ncbi:MAG: TRAP transporter large permease [Lachnospiraceae bacterium]|nr:TRAP transporter large permease [Lachnospiraceae bacterium]